ncbi:MAG: hypothetical protein QM758_28275 [Armatimonas sp.]
MLSGADIRRSAELMTFLERRSRNPNPRSTQITTVTWNGKEAVYDGFDEYLNKETILPLSELRRAASEGSRRGLRVVTLSILSQQDAQWESVNEQAREALEKVPGFKEVKKRFEIRVVRLQQDIHGIALVASLTPHQLGELDIIEWHCPLSGGDGQFFLSRAESVTRLARKNAWLPRWKKAKRGREILARVRGRDFEIFLVEGDRELPVARLPKA